MKFSLVLIAIFSFLSFGGTKKENILGNLKLNKKERTAFDKVLLNGEVRFELKKNEIFRGQCIHTWWSGNEVYAPISQKDIRFVGCFNEESGLN